PIDIDADIVVPPKTSNVVGPAVFVVPFDAPFIFDFTFQGTYTFWYHVNNTTVTQIAPVGWGTLFNAFPYATVTIPLPRHPERVVISCLGRYTGQLFRSAVAEQEDPSRLPMPRDFPLFPPIPTYSATYRSE